ncbi:hypothetical protein [Algibacter mikhailovii]|uniref:Uncharacterized protein n=1 Tax=Algibacter mikhailovii TaxID=425498 RepID=A0A918QS86_9FLAO|nr:hypothetical protein [Algibacter mikhailovii]GGZ67652.1 hypothetical protein GCM10007028_00670 [Algibacter mikhailovii]
MISTAEKHQVLKSLIESHTFLKSTTSKVLLKYIIESSIENKDLNATNIALELFGSKYESEKSEATVRVNIYHLRNKLQKYYAAEGINDPIHIVIKRGQYKVSFYKKAKPKPKYSKKSKVLAGLSTLTILALAAYLIFKLSYTPPIWHSFFNNDKETTLYLYDIFGYYGPTLFNKTGWHRDYEINSTADFYNEIKKQPDLMKDYSPGRNVYVNFLSAYSVNDLSRYFQKSDKEFKIHKFHNLTLQQLKEQNSLYIGPLRYENAFVEFFNLKSKRVKLINQVSSNKIDDVVYFDNQKVPYNEERNVKYKNTKKNIDTTYTLMSNGHSYEHVLVAKLIGDNNTSNLMFFSNHGFGATAAVEYFTNQDSIMSFYKKYLKNSEEFIALFYVNGKDRTSMNITQLLFDNNE